MSKPTRSIRSQLRRITTLVAAALVAATLTGTGTGHAIAATSGTPAMDAVAISAGSLEWGIKASWRNYIGTEGTTLEGGATLTDDGLFSFPLRSGNYDTATGTTTLEFDGSVHFQSYCTTYCLLDTSYGNFTIEIGPDSQILSGDWAGRLREDPEAGRESHTAVPLATLQITGVTPAVTEGTTTWQDVPTIATDAFATYPAGTRLDAVTIHYEGPGGSPSIDEHWDSPGAPVYTHSAQWVSDKKESNSRIAYPSSDGDTVVIVQGATGAVGVKEHVIVAVDPHSLEPLGQELRIPENDGLAMLWSAFDPDSTAVFWPSREGDIVTVHRSVWNAEVAQFTTSSIGTLPAGAVRLDRPEITSFAWNPVRQELAVVSGYFDVAAPQTHLTILSTALGEWTSTSYPLDLPATLREEYRGSLGVNIPFGTTSVSNNLAVFPDGSYVLAGGGSVTAGPADRSHDSNSPIPAFHIRVDDGVLNIVAIAGSEPEETPYGFAHGTASLAANDVIVLSSGVGPFRPISLQHGEAVAGAEFTLDIDGNVYAAPVVAVDPVTGFTIATNFFAKTLLIVDDGVVVASQDAPFINGQTPTGITIGPDGSLYLQMRTADGFGGIERMSLVGTVPLITEQPSAMSVDLSASDSAARFSVAATGSPTPAIQWQSRTAGAGLFTDINGATASTFQTEVTAADNGTEFRAIVSSQAGEVATEAAALEVFATPRFTQHPEVARIEPGGEAVFRVAATGSPEPIVTWERATTSGWEPVIINGVPAIGNELVLESVDAELEIRAVASNDRGVTPSNAGSVQFGATEPSGDGSTSDVAGAGHGTESVTVIDQAPGGLAATGTTVLASLVLVAMSSIIGGWLLRRRTTRN